MTVAGRGESGPGAALHRVLPGHWPLALRVVVATTLLAILAILTVGAYLSSVIADGLYEQRRDRVLEESQDIRDALIADLDQLSGATGTQQQDAATAFVQEVRGQGGGSRREAALVPVETTGMVWSVYSDRSLSDMLDAEFSQAVAADPESLVWKSVALPGAGGETQPGLLVGTRVVVAGSGSYDLFLAYSMQEEQDTLAFVQRVVLGGGAVLPGQEIADGPHAVLAVQQAPLAGRRRGGGVDVPVLRAGEGARGRKRSGGVDPVDRRAPGEGAVLLGGAHEALLDAHVRGARGRGGEGAAAFPLADQPGERVQGAGEGGVERDGHRCRRALSG